MGWYCSGILSMQFSPLRMTGFVVLASLATTSLIAAQPDAASSQESPNYDFSSGYAPYEHFYVGVDGRPIVTTGIYAGLPNPNYNRLTFLFSHVEEIPADNHFHGIGAYSYSGTADSPVVSSTSANNRIPEPYALLPPLSLTPGTGVFAGRQVTQPGENEYSNLLMTSVASLLNYNDPGAQILHDSSAGRWNGALANASVALEVVSLTPGLKIANEAGQTLLSQVGDLFTIGQGDSLSFRPVFWTEATAKGAYSATFKLRDVSGGNNFADSGTFSIDVATVPESSTLLGLGVFGLLAGVVKRHKAQVGHA